MSESIADIKREKGLGGPPMLHGSDLPKKVKSVTIVVKDIRKGPDNFNSIAIIDLEKEVYGCVAWSVNSTNMNKLLKKVGLTLKNSIPELAEKWRGKKILLSTALVNNPQTGEMGPSLFID